MVVGVGGEEWEASASPPRLSLRPPVGTPRAVTAVVAAPVLGDRRGEFGGGWLSAEWGWRVMVGVLA